MWYSKNLPRLRVSSNPIVLLPILPGRPLATCNNHLLTFLSRKLQTRPLIYNMYTHVELNWPIDRKQLEEKGKQNEEKFNTLINNNISY